jgi:hypothetical protein
MCAYTHIPHVRLYAHTPCAPIRTCHHHNIRTWMACFPLRTRAMTPAFSRCRSARYLVYRFSPSSLCSVSLGTSNNSHLHTARRRCSHMATASCSLLCTTGITRFAHSSGQPRSRSARCRRFSAARLGSVSTSMRRPFRITYSITTTRPGAPVWPPRPAGRS